MGEPFTVETTIPFEEYKRYAWFWYLRIGKGISLSIVLFAFAIALELYIIIYEIFSRGFDWQAVVPSFIVLLYIPMFLAATSIRISSRYKKRWQFPVRYEFSQDGFGVDFQGAPLPNHEEHKYWMLRRVGDTKDAFYLDWGGGVYYIVPKHSMGGDTQERFAAMLKQGLGKKYIKCF